MSCSNRHVLVTGASSGIGRATALRLAADGWHVYAGVRRTEDGAALRAAAAAGRSRPAAPGPGAQRPVPASRGELTPLLMDVTVTEQIKAGAETVTQHAGATGLDGLVDNAGIGVTWPLELVPLDAFRRQFEVNVVGQLAVTQAFLPLLRKARGRIVIIGSIGDRITLPFGGPLASSKCAIASLADAFRQELAPFGIRVVLLEPASIHTEAIDKLERDAHQVVRELPDDLGSLYRDSYLSMIEAAAVRERRGSPPTVVAAAVAKALTSPRPRTRYLVGKDARLLATLAGLLPTPALDALRRKLFHLPAPGSRPQVRQ